LGQKEELLIFTYKCFNSYNSGGIDFLYSIKKRNFMTMPLIVVLFLCSSANNANLDRATEGLKKPEMRALLCQKAHEEFKALKNKEDKSDLRNPMLLIPVWF
jgi:hypothetical protein